MVTVKCSHLRSKTASVEPREIAWAVKTALRVDGTATLVARGSSMMPNIWSGCELRLRPITCSPRVGECVLALDSKGTPVFHRVVSVDREQIGLRGDAQNMVVAYPLSALVANEDGWHVGLWRIPIAVPLTAKLTLARSLQWLHRRRKRLGSLRRLAHAGVVAAQRRMDRRRSARREQEYARPVAA